MTSRFRTIYRPLLHSRYKLKRISFADYKININFTLFFRISEKQFWENKKLSNFVAIEIL